MSPVPLSPALVGQTTDPTPVSWDTSAVLLYACGVGAQPATELDFLYEGRGPRVLPTYAVIPGSHALGALLASGIQIDPMMVLHGEQSIVLHRTVPPEAKAQVKGRISEVWDKGTAAVVGCEGIVEDDDGPMFTVKATLFVRGAGGFGGERGPSSEKRHEPPERDPDLVVEQPTRPEQAAVYRLSGDRNPLHIDPGFATAAGFDAPFLHGLCTYGFVGRAVLHGMCGGDPGRFRSFEARFRDRVYPGDTIVTKLWRTGAASGDVDEVVLQAETQRGDLVLSQARATFDK